MKPKVIIPALALFLVCFVVDPHAAFAQVNKPNILIMWGDDIGVTDVSAYSGGLMGFETPNIDRIGREGIRLQHYYGEQSCTAGRSAFLTGQHIIRTGLSKVGYPGAPMGLSQEDPTVGVLMKSLGYATGQLGVETIDDETSQVAIDFMKRQHDAGKPFLCWMNTTRMHLRTHVRTEHRGRYTHGDSDGDLKYVFCEQRLPCTLMSRSVSFRRWR